MRARLAALGRWAVGRGIGLALLGAVALVLVALVTPVFPRHIGVGHIREGLDLQGSYWLVSLGCALAVMAAALPPLLAPGLGRAGWWAAEWGLAAIGVLCAVGHSIGHAVGAWRGRGVLAVWDTLGLGTVLLVAANLAVLATAIPARATREAFATTAGPRRRGVERLGPLALLVALLASGPDPLGSTASWTSELAARHRVPGWRLVLAASGAVCRSLGTESTSRYVTALRDGFSGATDRDAADALVAYAIREPFPWVGAPVWAPCARIMDAGGLTPEVLLDHPRREAREFAAAAAEWVDEPAGHTGRRVRIVRKAVASADPKVRQGVWFALAFHPRTICGDDVELAMELLLATGTTNTGSVSDSHWQIYPSERLIPFLSSPDPTARGFIHSALQMRVWFVLQPGRPHAPAPTFDPKAPEALRAAQLPAFLAWVRAAEGPGR